MTEEKMEEMVEEKKSRFDEIQRELRRSNDNLSKAENEEEVEKELKILDNLLRRIRMEREASEELLNDLEVEHFLSHGPGRNFDMEYNN